MRSPHCLLMMLLLLAGYVSCGGNSDDSDGQQREEDGGNTGGPGGADITFDSEMNSQERSEVNASTRAMRDYVIDGNQIRRFGQIFGGNNSSNVVNFFETRVNYVLSASTDLDGRIAESNGSGLSTQLSAAPETLASNPSSILWYISKASEPQDIVFEINGRYIDIPSSRVGIIQLGTPYLRLETVQQVTTLVHEARHSDCTGGALASDIERIQAGLPPLNNKCGHAHVLCPEGHPYEGTFACDAHPWGAYVVGAIYASAVALTCTSCSETDKTVAEAMAIDSISRPLYDVNDLLNGEFGPPDMSSSNQVRQQ